VGIHPYGRLKKHLPPPSAGCSMSSLPLLLGATFLFSSKNFISPINFDPKKNQNKFSALYVSEL